MVAKDLSGDHFCGHPYHLFNTKTSQDAMDFSIYISLILSTYSAQSYNKHAQFCAQNDTCSLNGHNNLFIYFCFIVSFHHAKCCNKILTMDPEIRVSRALDLKWSIFPKLLQKIHVSLRKS